jgi:serine/threonine protein phosphatase PrpC
MLSLFPSRTDMLAERDDVCLILDSDGLYEVTDNEEIAMRLTLLRETGFSVAQALKKGSSECLVRGNLFFVVMYNSIKISKQDLLYTWTANQHAA